jgi:hypothetical protein
MTIDIWARESSYRLDVHCSVSLLDPDSILDLAISEQRAPCSFQLG